MKNQSNYKIKLITDNFIKLYIFLLCIVNTLFSQEMSNRTTLKYLAYEANYSNDWRF